MIGICQIVLLFVCAELGASVKQLRDSSKGGIPHQGSAERICVVRQQGSDPVSVWRTSNNGRAISFGLMPNTTESRVKCLNVDGSCVPDESAASDDGVADVSACPDCPCEVDDTQSLTASNQVLYDEIVPVCARASKRSPVDVLMLGLGGGSLHRRVRQLCPEGTRIRSVEIDPRVAGVAERYFGVDIVPGVSEVKVADAGSEVQNLASVHTSDAGKDDAVSAALAADYGRREEEPPSLGSGGWDVVTVDCFVGHGETPDVCRSIDFITSVQTILKPSGKALQHFWHYSPDLSRVADEYKGALDQYKKTYGGDKVQVLSVMRAANRRWDDVVVAHK
jgi:hypothetical protein